MAEAADSLNRITSLGQLDDLLELSSQRPVWLFKHSLICPTSARAWSEFGNFAAKQPEETAIAVIEIQQARDISTEVAARTGLRHESPQVLLIRDGRPVWHASHFSITEETLEEARESHGLEIAN